MASQYLKEQQEALTTLSAELVQCLTELEGDQLKQCQTECLRRLPNNSYLSVNKHEIKRSVEGISKKFRVALQPEKSRELLQKTEQLFEIGDELDAERYDKEVEVSIIQFLLSVSLNPVNKSLPEEDSVPVLAPQAKVDWYKALVTDLKEEYSSDASFSCDEFSDESEEEGETRAKSALSGPVEAPPSSIPSYGSICDKLVRQFWRDYVVTDIGPLLPYSSSIFAPGRRVLTELQVLREIVSMLQGAPTSFIFFCHEGDVNLRDDLETAHYSNEAFYSALHYFHKKIEKVQNLHLICDDVNDFVSQQGHPFGSRTFQAFTCAIKEYLNQLNGALQSIEQKVCAQQEIVTLVALKEAVREHFEIVTVLYEMVQLVLSEVIIDSPSVCVTHLINVLVDTLQLYESMGVLTEYITKVVLTLLLCTLQPLLSTLDTWLAHGNLNNITGELFLTRDQDIPCSSRDFWEYGLRYKELNMPMERQVPGLLLPVSQAMYNAGRAVELVKSLGKLGEPDTNMFSTFLARVLHTDCLPVAPVVSEEKSVDFFTGNASMPAVQSNYDPLLMKNFQALACSLQPKLDTSVLQADGGSASGGLSQLSSNMLYERISNSLTKLPTIPSISVALVIQPLVEERCHHVSYALLRHLRTHFALDKHLLTLRRACLMEAGQPMAIFCHEIFKSVYRGEKIRELTSYLRECLAPVTEFTQYLKMEHCNSVQNKGTRCDDIDILTTVYLTYTPLFPVEVVIDPQTLSIYKEVFQLLLQINFAEWCVAPLCLNSFNTIPRNNELHWFSFHLLHFIQTIKTYALQRVLHCTGAEMLVKLEQTTQLEDFIKIHKQYCLLMREYCLLSQDLAMPLAAVRKVLNSAVRFRKLWEKGEISETDFRTIKSEVGKCRLFIMRAINIKAKQASAPQPHFDWLKAALETEQELEKNSLD